MPPSARRGRGRARGLEGVRQGADARGRGADRGHVLLPSREEAVAQMPRPPTDVLKADGLAAGKGVIICDARPRRAPRSTSSSPSALRRDDGRAEEFLEGEELSLLALCDGENVVPLAPAQDYKRIFDGDQGPNTGGMGSYSPVPGFGAAEVEEIVESVHRPWSRRWPRAASPSTASSTPGDDRRRRSQGARVQHPLRRPRDAGGAAAAALRPGRALPRRARARRSRGARAEFSGEWAVTLVLASAGYPESSSKGDVISGLEEAAEMAEITHAGTAARDGEIVTAGGRYST